ncbi:MAG TPA: hypothetical protein VJ697_10995 [Nitrososphaeraceae archaeon]|nr:hypothetical protein [Nitrososphaeraceae archaeon]
MYNNIDNSIFLDTSSSKRHKNQKIFCVICFPKIELALVNAEENRYKCPRCKNTYQPNFEMFPSDDILESSHEEQDEGTGLLCADNEFKQQEFDSGKIKRPKYMQDSDTTMVTSYKEY